MGLKQDTADSLFFYFVLEIANESERKATLQAKISKLSKAQRDTLQSVITHLAK